MVDFVIETGTQSPLGTGNIERPHPPSYLELLVGVVLLTLLLPLVFVLAIVLSPFGWLYRDKFAYFANDRTSIRRWYATYRSLSLPDRIHRAAKLTRRSWRVRRKSRRASPERKSSLP